MGETLLFNQKQLTNKTRGPETKTSKPRANTTLSGQQ